MKVDRGNLEVGGLVVAQAPNPPLIAALAGALVSRLADDGSGLDAAASALFYVGLTVWAWEELAHGVNWFRRLLGAGGLAFALVSLALRLD